MLALYLGGVEREGAGPAQGVSKAAEPLRDTAGEGRCFRRRRTRPGLGRGQGGGPEVEGSADRAWWAKGWATCGYRRRSSMRCP